MKFRNASALFLIFAALPATWGHAAGPAIAAARLPDFAGRDKQFAYVRTRIVEALKAPPNFAGHYTIVTLGCGSGCTSNLIIDRTTGKVSKVPFGGEMQQQLALRYRLGSNVLVANWFDDDLCVSQVARWNGVSFELSSQPKGQPDTACLS